MYSPLAFLSLIFLRSFFRLRRAVENLIFVEPSSALVELHLGEYNKIKKKRVQQGTAECKWYENGISFEESTETCVRVKINLAGKGYENRHGI